LIQLMSSIPDSHLSSCEWAIAFATGHRFVRSTRNEIRTREERVSQWLEWWQSNRDKFDSSRARLATAEWANEPMPKPETLQEILQAADNDYNPHRDEARLWLTSNGRQVADELKAIAI